MKFKSVLNNSIFGQMGFIGSQSDLDLLERYILYNLEVLKESKQIIISTNFGSPLQKENKNLWKKYFPKCILLDSKVNRGHNHGYVDLENQLFDWCKDNGEEWLCKISNDIILSPTLLDKEVPKSDFYYLNGIGYGGMVKYNFDFQIIEKEDFYPQGNFYVMNVGKCDYISDKNFLNETYEYIQSLPDYNGRIWEYIPGWACEEFLQQCVTRNNLSKYHLISSKNYRILLETVKNNQIHDSSHKNIMIEGVCHFQYPDQQIIKI